MVGDNPGVFIESNIIANLNDPVEYADVSWIKPGVSAWDRWWSGDYGPDAGFELGMNTATMKYFVDLADRMDWEYMIVDWTWYGEVFAGEGGPNPAADITNFNPGSGYSRYHCICQRKGCGYYSLGLVPPSGQADG